MIVSLGEIGRKISGSWSNRFHNRYVLIIGLAVALILYALVTPLLDRSGFFAQSAIVNPPGFAEIDNRGLDVVAAVMDRNGSLAVMEAGALKDDGVDPEETLIDIGSITKTVTAVAILKLVEQDRLDLDETLGSIWPDVPDEMADITVHDLLTHTSGLPEDLGNDKERLSREAFLERVFEEDLDDDYVGEYKYSNVGYGVLAAVVEVVSDRTFEAFVEEVLLEPAGLGPMGYERAYNDDRSLLTQRTWSTGFSRRTIRDASWGAGAPGWNLIGNGGMVTTPVAYLRFWSAVRDGRVISRSLLREAFTRHVATDDQDDSFYGYGLLVTDAPEHGTVYGHDGQNDVFSADWRDLSESGLVVFTAGRGQDAFPAMKLILRELDRRQGS